MAELADAQDLGSCAARRAGSTPASVIKKLGIKMSMEDRSLPECRGCFNPPTTDEGWCDRCSQIFIDAHKEFDKALRPVLYYALGCFAVCAVLIVIRALSS